MPDEHKRGGHGSGRPAPRRGRRWYGLAAGVVLAMAGNLSAGWAQSGPRDGVMAAPMRVQAPLPGTEAELAVPSVVVGAPASEVALGIRIAAGGTPPPNSLVRLRGLPPTAALTEGHAIAPGSWAVPMAALDGLKVILPAGLSGKREITVALVTSDGRVVHETKLALVIGAAGLIAPETRPAQATTMPPPAPMTPPSPPPAEAKAPPATQPPGPPPQLLSPPVAVERPVAPPPQALPAAPTPPAVERASPQTPPPAPTQPKATPAPPATATPNPDALKRAQGYFTRAQAHLRDGDIASARLFLQRAAEDGLADAALAMGATFDPEELSKSKAASIKPDPAEARRWYERAAELGSSQAVDRLKRLGAR